MAEASLLANEDWAEQIRSMFLASQEALRTIEQNLTNRTLLARIIRAEGLADDEGRALLGGGKAAPSPSSSSAASKSSGSTSTASEHDPAFTPTVEALARAPSGMVWPVIRSGTRF